jgi:adenylate cyclase
MEDHARQALNAAQGMVREIDRLNRELVARGKPSISVGIGLDTGEVVAGHVGSKRRLEFTLIGVPVNNAAYLSKVRPAKVLLSATTLEELPSGVGVAGLEAMLLKGAALPQSIYELEIVVIAEG